MTRLFHRLALVLIAAGFGAPPALAQKSQALDQALLPLFSQLPSDADIDGVKRAIAAINKKDDAGAESIAAGIADPLARKLVRWFELREGHAGASPEDIESFRRKNPGWPGESLRAQAEETLLISGEPDRILAVLGKEPPQTGAGKAALAVALLGRGDLVKATALAADAWRNEKMSDPAEDAVISRLGRVLKPSDHKYRADRILYADTPYDNIRALRIKSVQRVLPLVSELDRAKLSARLTAYRCGNGKACAANARKVLAKLPEDAQKDWGVYFHRALMLRKSGAEREAQRMMLGAPVDPKVAISLDQWWDERRTNAYKALYAHDHKTAYRLASEHGPLEVNALKEAEFIAGWISLRFLKDVKRSIVHFDNMRTAADGPVSHAQAEYWLGRAYSQGGNAKAAQQHYAEAAKNFHTYYGQIARQTLDKTSTAIAMPGIPPIEPGLVQSFVSSEAVRAIAIAGKAGTIEVMRALIFDQKDRMESEQQAVLLAHLALTLGDTQMAVKVGKTSMERGWTGMTRYAYPTVAIPAFEPLRSLPESALIYAIARQESEFNTIIKSHAGARGILQIMPGTAKGVCGQYKLKCDVGRLTADPAFNAKLATAYVADTADTFDGSYIMAIAGYNAGPGRVRGWVGDIGDPRTAGVDPIDWVEMLHLDETRDYVKKVMSNIQVYRAALGEPKTALRIRTDLVRGRR